MIRQGLVDSFFRELLLGVHEFGTDKLFMALYEPHADIGPHTTKYTPDGEVMGLGYVARGKELSGVGVKSFGGVAVLELQDVVWEEVDFQCGGALIYNADKGDTAVLVLDFGGVKTASGTFTVAMPPPYADSALVRLGR